MHLLQLLETFKAFENRIADIIDEPVEGAEHALLTHDEIAAYLFHIHFGDTRPMFVRQFRALLYDEVHGQNSYATTANSKNKMNAVWGAYQLYVREEQYEGPFKPLTKTELQRVVE